MADIFTSLSATGTKSELMAMLQVLRKYSHDQKEQYQVTKDCWYFDTEEFDDFSSEPIVKVINEGTLNYVIPGPYGAVADPYNAYDAFFTELADAAPLARFKIKIDGFDAGGDIFSTAILREGKLYFNTDYRDFENSSDETGKSNENTGDKILACENEANILDGITFVITGDLKKFKNRDAITIFIEDRGGIVAGSVTKKTDFLINNAAKSKTAKNNKAKELGVPIITEKEFLEKFELDYIQCKSKEEKMYESGYYDPIKHLFQPPRKLKKEPLTLQIIFECVDQSHHILQVDLDVADYMGLSCTPDMILACKTLDELEKLFTETITDEYSNISNKDEYKESWRIAEFQTLFTKKWSEIKQSFSGMEQIERIILKRIDARKEVRLIRWANIFHEDLNDLTKKAAICKIEQKEKNVAALKAYLDEQTIFFPATDRSTQWPSVFCGYSGKAVLDWKSLTEDAELFAKLIVTEDISELDHGEETTIVDLKTKQYNQTAIYYPGW